MTPQRMKEITQNLELWLDATVKLPAYYRRGIPLAEIRLLLHEYEQVAAQGIEAQRAEYQAQERGR